MYVSCMYQRRDERGSVRERSEQIRTESRHREQSRTEIEQREE